MLFNPIPPLTITNGLLVTPDRALSGAVRMARGRIVSLGEKVAPKDGDPVIDAEGACVYPGLINAHDHLEFNLFPHIGRGPYANSYDWFDDVNRQRDKPAMSRILAIPMADRLRWGGYRNLFSGVTTVAHHNPYHRRVFNNEFPVRVLRRYRWSHSLRLAGTYGGRPEVECKKAKNGEPFIMHLAEGVDDIAAAELSQLDRLGALTSHTVLVHGVGLRSQDHALLRERNAGLVWCPSSNLFLFDRTADIPSLLGRVPVALGTDSTLSGPATLFEELRTADRLGYVDPKMLTRMVTTAPADMLGLGDRAGRLAEDAAADVLILSRNDDDPYRNLIAATPADIRMVLIDGAPRFGDAAFADLFRQMGMSYERLTVAGAEKLITEPCRALFDRLHASLGAALPIEIE